MEMEQEDYNNRLILYGIIQMQDLELIKKHQHIPLILLEMLQKIQELLGLILRIEELKKILHHLQKD